MSFAVVQLPAKYSTVTDLLGYLRYLAATYVPISYLGTLPASRIALLVERAWSSLLHVWQVGGTGLSWAARSSSNLIPSASRAPA